MGTARAWDDVDSANALAYMFVAGIAGLLVTLSALEWTMLARERARGSSAVTTASRFVVP